MIDMNDSEWLNKRALEVLLSSSSLSSLESPALGTLCDHAGRLNSDILGVPTNYATLISNLSIWMASRIWWN
jgi:hypothetical protein